MFLIIQFLRLFRDQKWIKKKEVTTNYKTLESFINLLPLMMIGLTEQVVMVNLKREIFIMTIMTITIHMMIIYMTKAFTMTMKMIIILDHTIINATEDQKMEDDPTMITNTMNTMFHMIIKILGDLMNIEILIINMNIEIHLIVEEEGEGEEMKMIYLFIQMRKNLIENWEDQEKL